MGKLSLRPSSPDSFNDFFHHKSWPESWTSPDFPADEPWQERSRRFRSYPWWETDRLARLFAEYEGYMWPWGYFIYRTCYENVSEADWNEAMRKLDACVHCFLRACRRSCHPEPIRLVCDGYKNVVIEDRELLEGASVHQVRRLFDDWMDRHEEVGGPRAEYCLMIDEKALRSILKTPEPSEDDRFLLGLEVGYVILISRRFWEGGTRDPENYQGFFHLDITGLFTFMHHYQNDTFEESIPYIPSPGMIPCTDGSWFHVEDQDGDGGVGGFVFEQGQNNREEGSYYSLRVLFGFRVSMLSRSNFEFAESAAEFYRIEPSRPVSIQPGTLYIRGQ